MMYELLLDIRSKAEHEIEEKVAVKARAFFGDGELGYCVGITHFRNDGYHSCYFETSVSVIRKPKGSREIEGSPDWFYYNNRNWKLLP